MNSASRVIVYGGPADGFVRAPHHFFRCPNLRPGPRTAVGWLASQAETWKVYNSFASDQLKVHPDSFSKWVKAAAAESNWLTIEPLGADRQGNPTYTYKVHLDAECGPDLKHQCGRTQETSAREDQDKKINSLSPPKQAPGAREPHPIPDNWRPNHTHQKTAEKYGIDLSSVLEEFYISDQVQNRELRSNWDRSFGEFIRLYADGRHEDVF